MALKTDFKDEILQEGQQHREYDLVSQNGSIIQTNVHLVRKDTPQQVGDNYGAKDINELNTEVNDKLPSTYKPNWNDVQSKPSTFPSTWATVANKPTNLVTGTGVLKIQSLTQSQYNALSTKDSTTLYIIVG